MGPPQFYDERRYVDIVEGAETHGHEPSPVSSPAFLRLSLSDFLTPLAKAPHRQLLVAEITLTWSSNSTPTGYVQKSNLTPSSWKSLTGKYSNVVEEQDSGSKISSTIDQDVRQYLDEFDAT